jgi:hypothetical protein
VRNCQLYEFEPDMTQPRFPWHVWRYDTENAVTRHKVSFL